jgi:NADPH:quinone reductase-like Zn-dependent oxidoreductase
MKAAIVTAAGKTPAYGDFQDPVPSDGEVRVKVTAAALPRLAKMRAAGTHYSSTSVFPFVPGIDGVGKLDDGQRVYFAAPTAPFGSMAELTVVKRSQCVPLPDDLDDVTAAAIANPGMASMAALKERAKLVPGETVLINGGTGSAGRLSVQVAKYLGANRVIVTGRDEASLAGVHELGADVTILLTPTQELASALAEEFRTGVNVVLDYLWGPAAEQIILAAAKNGREGERMRYVQIGSLAGETIELPAQALRATALELMGTGLGSVHLDQLVADIGEVLRATKPRHFEVKTTTEPLANVETAWLADTGSPRMVFLVD